MSVLYAGWDVSSVLACLKERMDASARCAMSCSTATMRARMHASSLRACCTSSREAMRNGRHRRHLPSEQGVRKGA